MEYMLYFASNLHFPEDIKAIITLSCIFVCALSCIFNMLIDYFYHSSNLDIQKIDSK